jgi:hypothetical protein
MYKFSVFEFNTREIDQIVEILVSCNQGRINVFDARKISKQVKDYALSWGILIKNEEGRIFCRSYSVPFWHREVPVEAIWRMVQPMFEGQEYKGHSLANNRGWLDLNIYPEDHRNHTQRDMDQIIDILSYLEQYGYISVLMGGSVWEIRVNTKK